ncbi:hypothetical protein LguiB_008478 [Lonicera macranthoides]
MTWHLISSSQLIFSLFNFSATPLIPAFTTIFSAHSIDSGHFHFFSSSSFINPPPISSIDDNSPEMGL